MSDEFSFLNRFKKPANGRPSNGGAGPPVHRTALADEPGQDMVPPSLSEPVLEPTFAPRPEPAPEPLPEPAPAPIAEPEPVSRATPVGDRSFDGQGDLADHFLGCAKLGRYLTVADNSRFIITDDFRTTPIISAASTMAAIYSKDYLVAQAALLPLSETAQRMSPRKRDRFERLFALIEEQALSDDVRDSAQAIRAAHFRAAEIRELEAELGNRLSPARLRYRQFLDIVKKLMDRKITAGPFLDEFRGFTQDVAGQLDFGIYSFCLDRLFGSVRVPLKVKKLLILELLKYPALIRRELLTNILVYPGQVDELVEFIRYMVTNELGQGAIIEIELLEAFKMRRLSMSDIESSLARAATA